MLGVMEDMLQYREYMAQALELARKGAGWVDPNPLVGVVVVRDGEVLATGYHDRYRGPHAERMAFDYADANGIDLTGATVIDTLEPCCHVGSQPACTDLILAHGIARVVVSGGEVLATGYHDRYRGPHAERMAFDYADAHGIDLTGATVIDTLEPCCHVGSQPACTALILAHGIARVVVGSVDPNPIVAGKGLRILEEAGVEVVRDVMREECDAINRHFFHYITTGKPYIVDGRRRAGESDSEYAVRRRELYATYAAVLAGTESDVPDESFAHFNGPVQAVGADEVVIGGHRPLLLEAGALACTDPDEWLSELGKRKIDSLIVESDEAFERLSMACQKD